MILKCVIVDDEDFAINAIKDVIEKLSLEYPIEIVKTYNNSVKALNDLKNIDFNLLFVDYEMPGYNGVEFVNELNKDVSVIFVSSFHSKSIDIGNSVKKLDGFLKKPPQIDVLRNIIKNKNLAIKQSYKIEKIIIPDGKNELYFDKDEIYYIESFGPVKKIFSKSLNEKESDNESRPEDYNMIGKIVITFKELEEVLANKGFEVISNKHMVNINQIRERTKTKLILKDKTEISIGESKKMGLFKRLNSWFKSK